MNVAVMKTKAEQALTERFAAVAAALPGSKAVAQVRKKAIGRFAALGLPHRRIEEWKYTDLRAALKEAFAPAPLRKTELDAYALAAALGPLGGLEAIRLVFLDGRFVPGLSRLDAEHGSAYHFDPLARALENDGFDWLLARLADPDGPKSGAVLALNAAFMTDGVLLRVVEGARLAAPIHLVFASSGAEPAATATRNFIQIGAGARAVILEQHVTLGAAPSQTNTATEIAVGDRARFQHIKHVPPTGTGASNHLATWIATLGAGAEYRAFQFTAGAALARNQLFVTFAGEGAKLDISGAFLARGTEHVDTTLVVDHAVPGCESRELFKGVLDGRARGVFQGKVIVRPHAQKSDGKQMAQALMLSPDAEFDSKPELEIYADDVVCGHGSTAAELDSDLVFYCRTRGIPGPQARALLIEAFVGEAIEKVVDEAVRAALMEAARDWLSRVSQSGG